MYCISMLIFCYLYYQLGAGGKLHVVGLASVALSCTVTFTQGKLSRCRYMSCMRLILHGQNWFFCMEKVIWPHQYCMKPQSLHMLKIIFTWIIKYTRTVMNHFLKDVHCFQGLFSIVTFDNKITNLNLYIRTCVLI